VVERVIIYRGSLHDLATDIAYELTPADAAKLIAELERFTVIMPDKFQDAYRRMNRFNDEG
jgi:hypothetical protein